MKTVTFGDIFEVAMQKRIDRLHKDGITERSKIFDDIVRRFEQNGSFVRLQKMGITKEDFCVYINEVLDKKLKE